MSIYKKFCRETFDGERLVKFELDFPESFNFAYDVVDAVAAGEPGKRALVWCGPEGEERVFTFAHMREWSCRYANVFRSAGVGRGDRVLLILKKHYEYWFAVLALHKLGAVAIPATHMLTVPDLAYRLRASSIRAAVVTGENGVPQKLLRALQDTGMFPKLWVVRGEAPGFEDLGLAAGSASPELERVETSSRDPMLMYFTSGTTGHPKGVVHDFAYPLAHIVTAKYWQCAEDNGLHFTVAETGWAKASWGKLYGQWLVGSAVMVYDFDSFEPRHLVQVINRFGVTSFCAPPTVYRYLVRKGIEPMPTLRHAVTAGEALAPEVFRRFTALTGIPLREGYGQTETTLLAANFAWDGPCHGSIGRPSPFYEVKLLNGECGEVKDGEVGEICVALPEGGRQVGVFTGYLDDPEQYDAVWRGGVYHTGDAAVRDGDGRLWFKGRFDDIIKTGGFRVGPFEVESVLSEHPAVAECSVIGVPDPARGQAIKAVIVPGAGYSPTPELAMSIRDFANRRLAEYKWVRIVEFAGAMPKTISGKIRKNVQRGEG